VGEKNIEKPNGVREEGTKIHHRNDGKKNSCTERKGNAAVFRGRESLSELTGNGVGLGMEESLRTKHFRRGAPIKNHQLSKRGVI